MFIKLTPAGFKTWKLIDNFKTAYATVPKDFETDLASTPRILWAILPPFGKYTQAAVVHDYLYRTHEVSRKKADKIFYELMLEYNTWRWKAFIMYYAVRLFGGFAWK